MRKLLRISQTEFNFAVHYAVVVMKKSVYHDQKKTLKEKMLSTILWEHAGGNEDGVVKEGDARLLSQEELESIYAIEEDGETKYSAAEISEKFYRKLMSEWMYFPLWWNYHDLAIRLSYLILTNKSKTKSVRILTDILIGLKKALINQVVETAGHLGAKAVIACWFGIVALAMIFPLGPVGSGILFDSWCTACFGTGALQGAVLEGSPKLEDCYKKLQKSFPSLAELHKSCVS